MKVLLVPGPPQEGENVHSGVDSYLRELTRGMNDEVKYTYLEDPFYPRDKAAVPATGPGRPPLLRKLYSRFIPFNIRLFLGYLRDTLKLASVMKPFRGQVDIIHVNRIGCEIQPIAAKLAGFEKVVSTIHNLPGDTEMANHWVRRVVERIAFACTDLDIAVSEEVYEVWRRRIGLSKNKVEIVYNGMEPTQMPGFDRDNFRRKFSRDPDAVFFGICAQLEIRKGIMVLLDAFKKLTDENTHVYLFIVGKGPEEKRIRSLVQELGIASRVFQTGYVSDVHPFTASFDVNALPSISLEALAYGVIEAMFLGVPSIVSDVGGAKELMIPSGGGRVVPRNNVTALYKAMKFYAENPQARKSDGAAAKQYANVHLLAKTMAGKTLGVYKRLLGDR